MVNQSFQNILIGLGPNLAVALVVLLVRLPSDEAIA